MAYDTYIGCETCLKYTYFGNHGIVGHWSDEKEVSHFIWEHARPRTDCRLVYYTESADYPSTGHIARVDWERYFECGLVPPPYGEPPKWEKWEGFADPQPTVGPTNSTRDYIVTKHPETSGLSGR